MPRRITVTFADGSQHIYENAPDDVTPQQVVDRATREFRKPVKGLDGGRGVVERTARAIGGIASGIYDAADRAMQPVRDAVGYDPEAARKTQQARVDRINTARDTDLARQDGFFDRVGDLFQKGEAAFDAGMFRFGGDSRNARTAEATANRQLQGEVTWQEAKGNWLKLPQFIAEQGVVSLPSMAAAAAGAPGMLAAAASNTGSIAQSRAEGDGRTDASGFDVAIAAPFGAASALLDLKGIDSIIRAQGKNAFTRILKAGAGEGLTEALQSAIEYIGGAAGTTKGFSTGEMFDQALQGGLVGAGVGSAGRAAGEAGRGALAGAGKVYRLAGNVAQRPIGPGKIYEDISSARVTPEDEASPIPTEDIAIGKAEIAAATGKSSADSILAGAGMPKVGQRVRVQMPNGSDRTGTVSDAFDTDAGDFGRATGMSIQMDDGSILAEHFDTLTEAGVKITPLDAAASANAEFDAVVNAAAQQAGVAAPGSGLLNPPALPAPEQQGEGNRGTPVGDGVAIAKALFPKAQITSGYRGPDHPLSQANPNSWHTKSHGAVDMAPIPGMTFEQAKQTFTDAGYTLIEALNETGAGKSKHATGDHWHFVIGQGGSQQAGPRATSAPIGGESVQDDMFGGVSLTESQIAARDNIGRVLDEAVQEDDTFDLRKAARELEAARVDFEATGRQGKFSDYVDPMSDIPLSLRQSIDANPNLLPLVLQRAGIEDAAANVAAPTDAQKEAGNYRKGHVRLHGLDITIETPRGAERSGTDPSGKAWSVSMPDHYGYVKRTEGADGEQVDVYVGPNPESTRVFLIDQNDAETGQFDEHKAMLGYRSVVDATEAYAAAFDDGRGPERLGNVVEMSTAEFKEWLKQPQTRPAGETIPQGTTGTGAAAPAAELSSNPEQLPAAQEDAQEGPLSTETMPGAGARNKLVLRTHKVDGEYRVDADYELGGFSGGGLSAYGETPEAARAKMVEQLGRNLDPTRFGSAANDQHRSTATKMLKWLRRGEQQDTSGPQDGGVAAPVEAPEAGGPEATATSSAGSAAGAANPSRARVEDTGTGKSVVIIGASEAELAAVAAAIPNAKALPPHKSDGGVVYSKKGSVAKIGGSQR